MAIKCSVCGKTCPVWFKNIQDYVYKIRTKKNCYTQCSYTCWREQQRRLEDYDKEPREDSE